MNNNGFKITAMTPEVLKDRFPDVYKAIHDEGYAHGKISGRVEGEKTGHEQGQRYAETMARMHPVPPVLTAAEQTAKDGKYFEMLAKQYMVEHKCSLGRAMMACAKLHPAEHLEFIKKSNS